MTRDYVIGVDCSTTAAKAVVWNRHGQALSSARSAFETSQPRPGWGEQNFFALEIEKPEDSDDDLKVQASLCQRPSGPGQQVAQHRAHD